MQSRLRVMHALCVSGLYRTGHANILEVVAVKPFFLQAVVEDGASHRLTTFIVTASRTHEVSPNKGYANVKNAHTCAHVVFLLWHAMLAARLWTHRVIPIALALGMRIAKPLHRVCVLQMLTMHSAWPASGL